MPATPAETPWLAWLAVAALMVVVPAISAWLTQRPLRRQVGAIHDNTVNTHSTILRDDLDAMATSLGELRGELGTTRTEIRGLHRDVRSLRGDVTELREADRGVREQLAEHLRGGEQS